jgi:hypothetical protein
MQAIAHVYNVTMSFEQMYILMSGVPYNPLTMKALDPKDWWIPVFHLTLVSFSALVVLSRIARTSTFWVFAAFYNFFIGVFILTFLVMCYRKTTR